MIRVRQSPIIRLRGSKPRTCCDCAKRIEELERKVAALERRDVRLGPSRTPLSDQVFKEAARTLRQHIR